jgi:hypothetical protein
MRSAVAASVVAASAVVLCACSLSIRRIDPAWDGRSQPDCDDGPAPVIVDAIMTGLAGAVLFETRHDPLDITGVAVAVIAVGLAISGVVGEDAIHDCRAAWAQWRVGGAIGNALREPVRPRAADPRGWFCFGSPTVAAAGGCVRLREDCEAARDAAEAGVGDLGACALVETAWCVRGQCAATRVACESGGGACRETR